MLLPPAPRSTQLSSWKVRRLGMKFVFQRRVATLLPGCDEVKKISIVPRGIGALGYTMQQPDAGEGDRYLLTRGGTHTIAITVSGAKNAESAGAFIIFDAFVAEGAAVLTSTSATQTSSAGLANSLDIGDVLEFVFSEAVTVVACLSVYQG